MAHPVSNRPSDTIPGQDAESVDGLFAALYDELRDIAKRQRRRWTGDYTLNTTALLHEAYVKLADGPRVAIGSRDHFLALAARAMRHILCNHARDRRALKRGGSVECLPLDSGTAFDAAEVDESSESLVALDDALQRLATLDPRQSQVVECRFFGGLTVEETARALDISPRTVKRDWAMAQAWLHRELSGNR